MSFFHKFTNVENCCEDFGIITFELLNLSGIF